MKLQALCQAEAAATTTTTTATATTIKIAQQQGKTTTLTGKNTYALTEILFPSIFLGFVLLDGLMVYKSQIELR